MYHANKALHIWETDTLRARKTDRSVLLSALVEVADHTIVFLLQPTSYMMQVLGHLERDTHITISNRSQSGRLRDCNVM